MASKILIRVATGVIFTSVLFLFLVVIFVALISPPLQVFIVIGLILTYLAGYVLDLVIKEEKVK